MRFQTRLKTTQNWIDLTPLVDVIFLMLIFFFVASDILPLKSLQIENPVLNNDSPPLTTQIIVVMDANQVIYLGSKKAIVDLTTIRNSLSEEISLLKKQRPDHDPTVVLSVDKRADYDSFLRLFSEVQCCASHIRLVYESSRDFENAPF